MLASVDFPAPEGPSTAQVLTRRYGQGDSLEHRGFLEVAGPDVLEHNVRVRVLEGDGVR